MIRQLFAFLLILVVMAIFQWLWDLTQDTYDM
jgi:hypothetical protein